MLISFGFFYLVYEKSPLQFLNATTSDSVTQKHHRNRGRIHPGIEWD
jgi:hypothetical protein